MSIEYKRGIFLMSLVICMLMLPSCEPSPKIDDRALQRNQARYSAPDLFGIDVLRFYVRYGAEQGQDGVSRSDDSPGGMFVFLVDEKAQDVLSTSGEDIHRLYDRVRADNPEDQAIPLMPQNKSSEQIVLIGRLPGDGRGPVGVYRTTITGVSDFEIIDNRISIEAYCEFQGPYMGFTPAPGAIYFVAVLRTFDHGSLNTGRYEAVVEIKPRGYVYEKSPLRDVHDDWFPTYPPMIIQFDVK